jgi:hypothetical protein
VATVINAIAESMELNPIEARVLAHSSKQSLKHAKEVAAARLVQITWKESKEMRSVTLTFLYFFLRC